VQVSPRRSFSNAPRGEGAPRASEGRSPRNSPSASSRSLPLTRMGPQHPALGPRRSLDLRLRQAPGRGEPPASRTPRAAARVIAEASSPGPALVEQQTQTEAVASRHQPSLTSLSWQADALEDRVATAGETWSLQRGPPQMHARLKALAPKGVGLLRRRTLSPPKRPRLAAVSVEAVSSTSSCIARSCPSALHPAVTTVVRGPDHEATSPVPAWVPRSSSSATHTTEPTVMRGQDHEALPEVDVATPAVETEVPEPPESAASSSAGVTASTAPSEQVTMPGPGPVALAAAEIVAAEVAKQDLRPDAVSSAQSMPMPMKTIPFRRRRPLVPRRPTVGELPLVDENRSLDYTFTVTFLLPVGDWTTAFIDATGACCTSSTWPEVQVDPVSGIAQRAVMMPCTEHSNAMVTLRYVGPVEALDQARQRSREGLTCFPSMPESPGEGALVYVVHEPDFPPSMEELVGPICAMEASYGNPLVGRPYRMLAAVLGPGDSRRRWEASPGDSIIKELRSRCVAPLPSATVVLGDLGSHRSLLEHITDVLASTAKHDCCAEDATATPSPMNSRDSTPPTEGSSSAS